jgi:hypothetical protein
MATTERKYKGSLTLGKLEIALEAHEQLFGELTKLEALLGFTVATYDDTDYPALEALTLMPSIGGAAPPAPAGATHMFDGEATILGAKLSVSVYRTS